MHSRGWPAVHLALQSFLITVTAPLYFPHSRFLTSLIKYHCLINVNPFNFTLTLQRHAVHSRRWSAVHLALQSFLITPDFLDEVSWLL